MKQSVHLNAAKAKVRSSTTRYHSAPNTGNTSVHSYPRKLEDYWVYETRSNGDVVLEKRRHPRLMVITTGELVLPSRTTLVDKYPNTDVFVIPYGQKYYKVYHLKSRPTPGFNEGQILSRDKLLKKWIDFL